ncbi:PAS domain-containing protein [Lactococcus protaetiae]|uniref:Histidine kinase n=1 Tax=Lactococcus protaetiae TaxID=2592653 RepID=A0A514Z940_9LACT|nr:PAS domain-containing protein [Lactococcus protaetiae]MCL2113566.1 PAS domain-containing protein [Streptococcaceae bacterium]QDK71092.1 histidine kinase [Lactococcus protaetiae]
MTKIKNRKEVVMTEEKLSEVVGPEAIIKFETGTIKASTLDTIIKMLPFEMGFCDADDKFRWFSNNPDRVHKRRVEAFGKSVLELHPGVAHHVKKVLDDFREGKADEFEFWFPKRNGQPGQIYQKFMAVRDENGKYLGSMDVTINLDILKDKEGKHAPETIKEFQELKPLDK